MYILYEYSLLRARQADPRGVRDAPEGSRGNEKHQRLGIAGELLFFFFFRFVFDRFYRFYIGYTIIILLYLYNSVRQNGFIQQRVAFLRFSFFSEYAISFLASLRTLTRWGRSLQIRPFNNTATFIYYCTCLYITYLFVKYPIFLQTRGFIYSYNTYISGTTVEECVAASPVNYCFPYNNLNIL